MPDKRTDTIRNTKKSEDAAFPQLAEGTAEAVGKAQESVEAAAAQTAAVTEHTFAAAAEIARTGSDAVQQTVQSGLDMATEITERVAHAFGLPDQATTDTTKRATQNVQVLLDCGTVIAHGLHDISREWLDQSRERFQKNLDGFSELLRARTPQDAVAAQSDVARETLKDVLEGSRRVSERMAALTDEAMKVIAAQDRRVAREARR